jgi:hypothetical protein
VTDSEIVDLRCDVNPAKLLARVQRPHIVEGNLIEIACDDCKSRYRRAGKRVSIVLHRFDVEGQIVESEVRQHGEQQVRPE